MGVLPETKRRNYLMDLTDADMGTVRFAYSEPDGPRAPGTHHFSVVIDRAAWDALGRPGQLFVSASPHPYEAS